MIFYRIGYGKIFVANKVIRNNDEIIKALSTVIKFKLFNKSNNKEIIFESSLDKSEEKSIGKIITTFITSKNTYHSLKDMYLYEFVKCSIKNNDLKIEIINEEFLDKNNFRIEYEIVNYQKEILENNILIPKVITKKEFYDILNKNIKNFNNLDNENAQTSGFYTYPIES